MSIRNSTVVNRSAAIMSRSGSVDESRDTVLMLDFHLFPIPTNPDAPRFYHLAQIGMNRGDSWPES